MVGGKLSLSFHSPPHYLFIFIGKVSRDLLQDQNRKVPPRTLIHFLMKLLKEEESEQKGRKKEDFYCRSCLYT
jgi:hypothetical protein